MHFLFRCLCFKPLHFVLLAVLLFVAVPREKPQQRLDVPRLSAAQVEALRTEWIAFAGVPPSNAELQRLVARELDDEVLVREALLQSLHLRDAAIKQRLVTNMRFLDAGSAASDDELFRQALALGMQRQDVVVRRRLVQLMRLSIEEGADEAPISAEELQSMYRQRRNELAAPPGWRLDHVYFSRDRRGNAALPDARAVLRRLSAQTPFEAAQRMGDPFLAGHRLPMLNAIQIDGDFGSGFSTSLAACEVRRWCGPLASAFGQHLVRIEDIAAGRVPDIGEPAVHARLVADVRRERGSRRMEAALRVLRRKYGLQR
jgi:hypothetical protein